MKLFQTRYRIHANFLRMPNTESGKQLTTEAVARKENVTEKIPHAKYLITQPI